MNYIKKRLCITKKRLAILFFLIVPVWVFAVPAKPGITRLITLSDGTQVSAHLVGDEFAHYWIDNEGHAYQKSSNNFYRRIDLQTVKEHATARRFSANQQRKRRLSPRREGESGGLIGEKKGLIILVNFSDVNFKPTNNNALYQRITNEKNFSYDNFKGSMYDYFFDQSEGQFELTFDVVGPVNVSQNQSYYGGNDSNGNDIHPAEMVIEAIKLADSQVNYADYDWDEDGIVDQVYVVYAGKGEADGGADDTIWPHEYNLYSAAYYGDGEGPQSLDGVWINTYACGGELNGISGEIAGIGTMCHEFSHCLGFPDFYDIDYSGGQGMFMWDLMSSGSYNGDGYRPSGYTGYERWMAGWKEPIELVKPQSISNMIALQDFGSNTYIIYNAGNCNEYFLLENRQKVKWDTDLPGAGLLILHIDYDDEVWSYNQPNDDPNHQRMTWIPADNQYQYETSQGRRYYTEEGATNDPFPYGSVNAFGRNTTPAAKLYNMNLDGTYYIDSSVESIVQNSDGTISFRFVPEAKKLTLSATPACGTISYMQEVVLTASNPNAEIYYTFDGSEPTKDDFFYDPPLQIDHSLTLKAKAFLDGYEDSETLACDYVVTNLEATKFYPEQDKKTNNKHAIPSITFNNLISEGESFSNISLLLGQTSVTIDAVVVDSILYLVPKNVMERGTYTVSVPSNAVFCGNNPNKAIQWSFKYDEVIVQPMVAAGTHHSFAIKEDGSLWGWGRNDYGQIGTGEASPSCSTPVKVLDNVVAVAGGIQHSLAIRTDGSLWAWGINSKGQLGNGTTENSICPQKILDDVIFVAAEGDVSMAIKSDGTLWAWGYGYLGNGKSYVTTTSPVQIMTNVKSVSPNSHVLAVKNNGSLWAWGSNWSEELGSSVSADYLTSPKQLYTGYTNAAAGSYHNLGIKTDGYVYAWGSNSYGQIGNGTTTKASSPQKISALNNTIQISAGNQYSLAVKSDGSLYAWGRNNYGQLGTGTEGSYRTSPVKVLDKVESVAAGTGHSIALGSDGNVYTWGWNSNCQIGNGGTDNCPSPQKVLNTKNVLSNLSVMETTTVVEGKNTVVSIQFEPANADYESMEWISSNENIASVSSRGIVTGIAPGEATLTVKVTSMDGTEFTASCQVTVMEDKTEIEVTDISQMDNVIYVEPVEFRSGSETIFSLKMKNTVAIRSFGFDLYLPEGITATPNSSGKPWGSLNYNRVPKDEDGYPIHKMTLSYQEDNTIRFLCDAQEGQTFIGNDGEIATLKVSVSETMADGDYPVILKNVKLSETDIANYYLTEKVISKITILSFILGDINNDGFVDVSDYSGVADRIHGRTPVGFNEKAGDVDENGIIDVSDYSGVANLIHYGSIHGKGSSPSNAKRTNNNVEPQ